MTLFLRYAALSDVGRVRRDNQDSGYVGPHLLVIADGVGGAARGDIASSAAVDTLRKLDVPPGNDALSELSATLHLAHDRLAEIVEAHPDLDGTSTTVSAAIFDGTHLRVGHVGDSRAYLLRDGVLDQITSDHTLVQSLVDEGRITEDEARVHPHRNLILRAVDGVHEPEPDLFSVTVQAGDRLLFCSDGCSGVLDPAQMASLLAGDLLESVAARLVTTALDAGSSDNVTVVVAEVVEGDEPPPGGPLVVGAAAAAPHLAIPDEATGNITESDVAAIAAEPVDPETIRYAPIAPPRGGGLRRLLVLALVLAVLGGLGWGAYAFSQTRYFLAEDDAGHVAVYQGVDFDLPLVSLNHLERATSFIPEDLGANAEDVREGKDFESLARALAFLRNAACLDRPTSSTPTVTPATQASVLYRVFGLYPVTPPKQKIGKLGRPPANPAPRWTGSSTTNPACNEDL